MTMTDSDDLQILIADDEPLAAERLQMLLARIDGIHLVAPRTTAKARCAAEH